MNGENLSQVKCSISDNSRHPANGVVLDTVAVTNSVEPANISRENGSSGLVTEDVGSNKPSIQLQDVVINRETCHSRAVAEKSSNCAIYENPSSSIDEELLEAPIVRLSEQQTGFTEETGCLTLKTDTGSDGAVSALANARSACSLQEIGERVGQTDLGGIGSAIHVANVIVLESTVAINADQTSFSRAESRDFEVGRLGSSKALVENVHGKVSKSEKESCVIDMNCSAVDGKGSRENPDGERVCRICHLGPEQLLETKADAASSAFANLIQLGCGCKDELGIVHSDCGETWFKLKGNRLCEICGQSAKNITGIGDYRFMEEWNERTFIGSSSSSERSGCWSQQSFCNVLMACLVIAFIGPWFLRVNLF